MTEFVCGVITLIIYFGLAGGFAWLFNTVKDAGSAVADLVKPSGAGSTAGSGAYNTKTGSGSSSYGEFTPIDTAPGWETSVGIFGTDGHGDGYGYYGGGFGDGE